MLPYKTLIDLNRNSKIPIYLQFANGFERIIMSGLLDNNKALPSARYLSILFDINRRTIKRAYEELEAQDWVRYENGKYFVTVNISKSRNAQSVNDPIELLNTAYPLNQNFQEDLLFPYSESVKTPYKIDDGFADIKLSPTNTLAKNYSSSIQGYYQLKALDYAECFEGDFSLRKQLKEYLKNTRGIICEEQNILLTRGSMMAFYCLLHTILQEGETVAVSSWTFNVIKEMTKMAKGNILDIPLIPGEGMDIDYLENILKTKRIKAVYVIPHHQFPTTVILSHEKRSKLLTLAEKYKFAIIEDDYDFDFHYDSSPILPMKSFDTFGSVAYVGSFSKLVAPALRIGFIIAPENLITNISNMRRYIDGHGNTAVERSLAIMFQEGEMKRHLKKAAKVYKKRRDFFCDHLKRKLGNYIHFDIPKGGLAVWVDFNKKIKIDTLRSLTIANGLSLPDGRMYANKNYPTNGVRMGFGNLTEATAIAAIDIIEQSLKEML